MAGGGGGEGVPVIITGLKHTNSNFKGITVVCSEGWHGCNTCQFSVPMWQIDVSIHCVTFGVFCFVSHLYTIPKWQLIEVNNSSLPQAFMLDGGLGDHDFMLIRYNTIQCKTKSYFLQKRKVLLMSRKWMISANVPPNPSML